MFKNNFVDSKVKPLGPKIDVRLFFIIEKPVTFFNVSWWENWSWFPRYHLIASIKHEKDSWYYLMIFELGPKLYFI